MLLRLTPGPAESRFGITLAPMAAVSDWYGRVVVPSLDLRGDEAAACSRLRTVHGSFDRRAASRPPFVPPDWAGPLVAPDAAEEVAQALDRARRGRAPSPAELRKLYRSLDVDGELLSFCANYVAACESRVPDPRKPPSTWEEETDLLAEMSDCRNDRVKFAAIRAFGAFAPPERIRWIVERAERRTEGTRNPNVVLVNCLDSLGRMVPRVPEPTEGGRKILLEVAPFPLDVLKREARNNGACGQAREALEAIIEATGSASLLADYLVCLDAPPADSDWMEQITARFVARSRRWLVERTGRDLGDDPAAWRAWLRKEGSRLAFDHRKKVFVRR